MAAVPPRNEAIRNAFLSDLRDNTGFNQIGQAFHDASCPNYRETDGLTPREVPGIPALAIREESFQAAQTFIQNGARSLRYRVAVRQKAIDVRAAHETLFQEAAEAADMHDLKAAMKKYSNTLSQYNISMKTPRFEFLHMIQESLAVADGKRDSNYKAPVQGDARRLVDQNDDETAIRYTSARQAEVRSPRTEDTTQYTTKKNSPGWSKFSWARQATGLMYYGVGCVKDSGLKLIGYFRNSKLHGVGERHEEGGKGAIGAFVGTTPGHQSQDRIGLTGWGFTWNPTSVKTGMFKGFLLNGDGTEKNDYGVQVGVFEGGKLVRGTHTDTTGAEYQGTFETINGIPKLHGKGAMITKAQIDDEVKYTRVEGNFKAGELQNGSVTYIDRDGNRSTGTYTDGNFDGEFVLVSGNAGAEKDVGTIQNGVWVKNG